MVAANKKRISSELLHIALVITLLRGNDHRIYNRSPVISTNFFNDVRISNDMGPSWAYSRTSFHHFYNDPPIYEMKGFNGNSPMFENGDSDYFSEDELDIDLNIINQLRSLTISRFNSLPRLGKHEPTFQDITAYLLNESTGPANAVSSPPSVPEYETTSSAAAAAPSPVQSEGDVDVEMMELSESFTLSPDDVDSGHEETGDDADARSTTSETLKEFPIHLSTNANRNSLRRESHGFHSDSEEEMVAYEIMLASEQEAGGRPEVKIEEEAEGEPKIKVEEESEVIPKDMEETTEENAVVEEIKDEELKVENSEAQSEEKAEAVRVEASALDENQSWEQWLDDASADVSLRLSPYLQDELDASTIDLLEHVHQNEVGGAAGIDRPSTSSVSQLLGWHNDSDYFNLPELFLEAERSSLEFYKKFNDISETEMQAAVAPQHLHEFEDDSAVPGTSSRSGEAEGDGEIPSKIEDADADATQDILSAMLDDILEGDSGVFDFLDNNSDRGGAGDFDDLSENSHDSVVEGPPSNAESGGVGELEESSLSGAAEMIQTAPIHASARPTAHAAQPRGFQVHARMPGLLRGGSMEQRWQDLANLLSLQSSSHDPSGGAGIHQPLPHHFAPHPYHHHHHHHHHPHTATPLHHTMHPTHFGSGVPPTAPYSTDTARSVLLQNATLPPPELNTTGPYVNVGMGASSNLGSAVASSMHLTNSSEPMIDPSSHYKMMDPTHDMLYYQNSTGEMGNQTSATSDGFNLSSILNDDELQLMDMAMNEGMYSMRSLDSGVHSSTLTPVGAPGQQANVSHNGPSTCTVLGAGGAGTATEDRMEASSDSAVSSMGSERVPPMTDPPMSDNEWVDADSHPHGPHDLSPYSMDYSRGKLGYEYYKDGSRGGPVAQKKHHMFGKRFQQEQSSHPYPPLPPNVYSPLHGAASQATLDLDKYGCSSDFGRFNGQGSVSRMDPTMSNHTYALPPTHPDNPMIKTSKQVQKEKQRTLKYLKNDEALTRDEKKARSMNIPITTEDIINLPMDEFNERLSKYDLSEAQLSLIRDIRRRGKNKVAAQNCRKRKLDQIIQLADEVQRIRDKKQNLMREQETYLTRRTDLKERYSLLYRSVFQALRDSDGNPYSPFEYNLHHTADGSVILLPRNASQPSTSTSNENGMGHQSNGRRDKPKDENKKE